jgi:hypothetical protein
VQRQIEIASRLTKFEDWEDLNVASWRTVEIFKTATQEDR